MNIICFNCEECFNEKAPFEDIIALTDKAFSCLYCENTPQHHAIVANEGDVTNICSNCYNTASGLNNVWQYQR